MAEYPLTQAKCVHNWRHPIGENVEPQPSHYPTKLNPRAVNYCGSCGVQFDSMGKIVKPSK